MGQSWIFIFLSRPDILSLENMDSNMQPHTDNWPAGWPNTDYYTDSHFLCQSKLGKYNILYFPLSCDCQRVNATATATNMIKSVT